MIIAIQSGCGEGSTPKSAFDAALHRAGIEDYNLLYLSSVIPAGADVQLGTFRAREHSIGHRLYVVMAHAEVQTPGTEMWAGLGWVQDRREGHGVFVEMTAESKEVLERSLVSSLEEMTARRSGAYGPPRCAMERAVCRDRPTAAIVAAVYGQQEWD